MVMTHLEKVQVPIKLGSRKINWVETELAVRFQLITLIVCILGVQYVNSSLSINQIHTL